MPLVHTRPLRWLDDPWGEMEDLRREADVWHCPRCGTAVAVPRPECASCGGSLAPAPLLHALPLLVRQSGATLELVSGEAAKRLEAYGGIGAILRYRPVPVGAAGGGQ